MLDHHVQHDVGVVGLDPGNNTFHAGLEGILVEVITLLALQVHLKTLHVQLHVAGQELLEATELVLVLRIGELCSTSLTIKPYVDVWERPELVQLALLAIINIFGLADVNSAGLGGLLHGDVNFLRGRLLSTYGSGLAHKAINLGLLNILSVGEKLSARQPVLVHLHGSYSLSEVNHTSPSAAPLKTL